MIWYDMIWYIYMIYIYDVYIYIPVLVIPWNNWCFECTRVYNHHDGVRASKIWFQKTARQISLIISNAEVTNPLQIIDILYNTQIFIQNHSIYFDNTYIYIYMYIYINV